MTPSRAGRTLLDAREQRARQSSAGNLEEWPTIEPTATRPDSDIAASACPPSQSSISEAKPSTEQWSENISSSDRCAFKVPHVTSSADDAASHYNSERTSPASFASIADGSPCCLIAKTTTGPSVCSEAYGLASPSHADLAELQSCTDRQHNSARNFPARRSSLGTQSDDALGELLEQKTQHPMPGFTSMLGGEQASTEDRRHSPSPASFSRPRPSSVAQSHQLLSPRSTTENAARALKAENTASRIPIPDTKKANLVEIKSRSNNSTPTGRVPTFGSRRLDAPDTLKILDQGIKRRQLTQLQRKATDGSLNSQISAGTRTTGPADSFGVTRSRASTLEDTFGTSSSEEEEITTPTFQPSLYPHAPAGTTTIYTTTHRHSAAFRLFDGAATALANTPPPSSPFTGTLQTIPSEAALLCYTPEDAPPLPTHSLKPSRFEELTERLSEAHERDAQHTAEHTGERAPVPKSAKYSLTELLNSYANEDESPDSGAPALPLDVETKHITRTLSLLEGKGAPPESEVDNETLLSLYGHMRRGLEKAVPNVSLADNAAVAQEFLAREESVEGCECSSAIDTDKIACDRQSERPQLPPLEISASKWSESTASMPMAYFDPQSFSSRQTVEIQQMTTPGLPPERPHPEPPQSIGYPSRVPSKAKKLIGPSNPETPSPTGSIRRLSSPTLGKRAPGSVRTARETLHQTRGGFARGTTATESKRTAKMPTSHTKPMRVPDSSQRGRRTSTEKHRKMSESSSLVKVSFT